MAVLSMLFFRGYEYSHMRVVLLMLFFSGYEYSRMQNSTVLYGGPINAVLQWI